MTSMWVYYYQTKINEYTIKSAVKSFGLQVEAFKNEWEMVEKEHDTYYVRRCNEYLQLISHYKSEEEKPIISKLLKIEPVENWYGKYLGDWVSVHVKEKSIEKPLAGEWFNGQKEVNEILKKEGTEFYINYDGITDFVVYLDDINQLKFQEAIKKLQSMEKLYKLICEKQALDAIELTLHWKREIL